MTNLSYLIADTIYQILEKQGQLDKLPEVIDLLKAKYNNTPIHQIFVITSAPLTDQQKKQLAQVIQQNLGQDKQIIFKVDKDLLGGLVIKYQDKIIDLSLKGRLHKIKQELTNE
ncbi:MAG: ATP synthase F1 subunit delta [bacterium]|nr:ATP synthase F1 subunit delta [bacterium]